MSKKYVLRLPPLICDWADLEERAMEDFDDDNELDERFGWNEYADAQWEEHETEEWETRFESDNFDHEDLDEERANFQDDMKSEYASFMKDLVAERYNDFMGDYADEIAELRDAYLREQLKKIFRDEPLLMVRDVPEEYWDVCAFRLA